MVMCCIFIARVGFEGCRWGIESRLTYNLDTTEEREISRIY
jgi:hypothetical protein